MQTSEMVEKGYAKAWTNPRTGEVRHYIKFHYLPFVEIEYYKSGNVSSAKVNGHSISNCAARRMLSSKLYVDQNGKYHWYGRESAIDEVIETLREM